MNAGGHAVYVSLSLLVVAFAGCVGPDGATADFDDIPVPAWQAGYSWSYLLSVGEAQTYAGPDGSESESERTQRTVTSRVTNTSQPLAGEAVYYVRTEPSANHPFLEYPLEALRQSDLTLAGVSWDHGEIMYAEARPVEPVRHGYGDMVAYPYYPPVAPYDPCQGRPSIEPVETNEHLPRVGFPIRPGQTQTGHWGEENDFGFTYRYKVVGVEPVTVPAGTFDAAHVRVDLLPQANLDDEFETFRISLDFWYAPEVQNHVKTVVTATATGRSGFGPASFSYEAAQELTEYSLLPGEAEPAPVERVDHDGFDYAPRRVVTDTEMPVNVADGPQNVTFGLMTMEKGGYEDPYFYSDQPAPAVAELPTGGVPETHRVQWTVMDANGRPVGTQVGEHATFALGAGGPYWVNAEVQPLECGMPWLGSYGGQAWTYWEDLFEVASGPGVSGPTHVTDFPVGTGGGHGIVTWIYMGTAGSTVDRGHPRIYDEYGGEAYGDETGSNRLDFYPYGEDEWTLVWQPDLPVTVGEPVYVRLRVNYYWDEVHILD